MEGLRAGGSTRDGGVCCCPLEGKEHLDGPCYKKTSHVGLFSSSLSALCSSSPFHCLVNFLLLSPPVGSSYSFQLFYSSSKNVLLYSLSIMNTLYLFYILGTTELMCLVLHYLNTGKSCHRVKGSCFWCHAIVPKLAKLKSELLLVWFWSLRMIWEAEEGGWKGETGSSKENGGDKWSITDGFKTETKRIKSNRMMSNPAAYVTD